MLRFCTYGHLTSHPAVYYRDKIPLDQVKSDELQSMIDNRKQLLQNNQGGTKDKLFINAT